MFDFALEVETDPLHHTARCEVLHQCQRDDVLEADPRRDGKGRGACFACETAALLIGQQGPGQLDHCPALDPGPGETAPAQEAAVGP